MTKAERLLQSLPVWDGRPILSQIVNLERLWDRKRLCRNPHKGWYLHYYDNSLENYGVPGDYLEDFPGLNHIYLRLAWSYLEPQEGRYDWDVIDRVIDPWVAHGYGVAFRITCWESDPLFATPEWVRQAGAEGTFHQEKKGMAWEPDYGDPVFLAKLARFHEVFAARYVGRPWLEYVDIGSYGKWGEGHTRSQRNWPVEIIKRHMDIHDVYGGVPVLINDDFPGSFIGRMDAQQEILDYALQKGYGIRDDSVCVSDLYGRSNLRNPEMFDLFWRRRPVDLEAGHHSHYMEHGFWKKGVPFSRAVEEAHATYIGFHGYARKWLPENPELALELANKAGYWYFLKSIEMDRLIKPGAEVTIRLVWENHGAAPAYHRYQPYLKLEGPSGASHTFRLQGSDNRKWLPGTVKGEVCRMRVPQDLASGEYRVKIGLFEENRGVKRALELGFKDRVRDTDGFYKVHTILLA